MGGRTGKVPELRGRGQRPARGHSRSLLDSKVMFDEQDRPGFLRGESSNASWARVVASLEVVHDPQVVVLSLFNEHARVRCPGGQSSSAFREQMMVSSESFITPAARTE